MNLLPIAVPTLSVALGGIGGLIILVALFDLIKQDSTKSIGGTLVQTIFGAGISLFGWYGVPRIFAGFPEAVSESDPSATDEPTTAPETTPTPEATPTPEPAPSDTPEPSDTPDDPSTQPQTSSGSSEKLQRCISNGTASNSPFVWLLPIALLSGIGYGVNEVYGPQIASAHAQLQKQFNEAVRKHTPDLGSIREPEWMRQARMQADAAAKQLGAAGESLQPVGQAAGVVLAIAALATLTYQACQPDGFDAWFGPANEGSSKN